MCCINKLPTWKYDATDLIVSDVVVRTHSLDLHRAEHPADIINDLDICCGRLLELKQLRGLHQVLELKSSFGHIVRLAPLLDAGDIILDLHS
jgi:hypothetical protein